MAVHHRGGHTSYYNSKALEMAGITKNTPNPPAAPIDKDAKGELNGRVTDRARDVFAKVGNRTDLQPRRAGCSGIATVWPSSPSNSSNTASPRVHHEGGDLMALQQVRARGDLLHRVSYEASGKMLDAMINDRHPDRFRRRMDPLRRHVRAHRRRLLLRAHHGDQPAVSRHHAAL